MCKNMMKIDCGWHQLSLDHSYGLGSHNNFHKNASFHDFLLELIQLLFAGVMEWV